MCACLKIYIDISIYIDVQMSHKTVSTCIYSNSNIYIYIHISIKKTQRLLDKTCLIRSLPLSLSGDGHPLSEASFGQAYASIYMRMYISHYIYIYT